jgi:DNA-binding protein H-NS
MAQLTYAQLQQQIEALQAQAEQARKEEMAEVIAKIKEAIDVYGLTAKDLFGKAAGQAKGTSVKSTAAKYGDGKGNSWVGRGPRPQWLRDALAAGKALEDFAVGVGAGASKTAPAAEPASAPAGKVSKATVAKKAAGKTVPPNTRPKAKYSDAAGNTWSGMGPKPQWLKDALAAGKTVEELMA